MPECAIVYDPHMQFTPRYYNEKRGDVILNPLDARCPSWSPSDDIDLSDHAMAEANAMAQATSLFTGKPSDRNYFFTYCSQLIWKHCIVEYQPDSHQMAHLMQYSDPLIDEAVRGTELVQMMAENAQQQRAAVVAHLTQIAFSLRQVPKRANDRPHFVARDWCKHRKGWLFLTNTQDTRDALRPLQSLWLDSLIMGLLSMGERPDLPPVLMAIDELQTLQKLPQLMPLVTEGRKSLRVLLGFQGRSQIRALYGEEAEAIFSAPFTKFLLRTSEPEASKWLCETVGDIEKEHLRETIPADIGAKGGHSYSLDKRVEKLLLASEFHGLDDLRGYLKYGNLILKMKLPAMPKRQQAEKFIPREVEPVVRRPLPTLEAIQKRKAIEWQQKQASEIRTEAWKQFQVRKHLEQLQEEDRKRQQEAAVKDGASPQSSSQPRQPRP